MCCVMLMFQLEKFLLCHLNCIIVTIYKSVDHKLKLCDVGYFEGVSKSYNMERIYEMISL